MTARKLSDTVVAFLLQGPVPWLVVPRDEEAELAPMWTSRAVAGLAWREHREELEREGARLQVPRKWGRRYFGEACAFELDQRAAFEARRGR